MTINKLKSTKIEGTKVKRTALIFCICTALLAAGCANTPNSQITPGVGTALDASTTFYALQYTDAVEGNPLLSWGSPAAAAIGSIALKQGIKYAAVNYFHADPFTTDTQIETAGVAAGVWNIGVIASAHPAVGIVAAAAAGYSYYKYRYRAEARRQAEKPRYVFPLRREQEVQGRQQAQAGEVPPRG
jgi:hypothetical protein